MPQHPEYADGQPSVGSGLAKRLKPFRMLSLRITAFLYFASSDLSCKHLQLAWRRLEQLELTQSFPFFKHRKRRECPCHSEGQLPVFFHVLILRRWLTARFAAYSLPITAAANGIALEPKLQQATHLRHTFLGLLAKIKCSICSYPVKIG